MILLIDNYDSFTYNVYQMLGLLEPDIEIYRNDAITIAEIEKLSPQAIVISPGPGYPVNAGISVQIVQHFSGKIPILGICLGHQAIVDAFGGNILPARIPVHGKASRIHCQTNTPLFKDCTAEIEVGRYHSLIADEATLPTCLQVIANDEDGQIMALAHNLHPTYGVQFHPESILSKQGLQLFQNFLNIIKPNEQIKISPILNDASTTQTSLKPFIADIIDGKTLTEQEAYQAMNCIMDGHASDAQIGAFLTALRMKGESVEEITGFARVMREKAKKVFHQNHVIDIVGTGGDLVGTFNISTTSAFVIAGANVGVAKHGNKSVSSKSGSSDVLEILDIPLDINALQAEECINKYGLSFLFAPNFHQSMRYAATARKEIGVRSIFNILGPLANPALSDYILLGVYDESVMEKMADVLRNLDIKGAMLVHGTDGLDEVSISSETKVCEIRDKKIIKYSITPEEFGLTRRPLQEVIGGTPEENALITLNILQGKEQGAKRDIVLLNAGCALYTANATSTIQEGIELAAKTIDDGLAMQKYEELKKALHTLKQQEQQ